MAGNLVRELRQRIGMTQEEFAHQLGITVGTVNRWENGRYKPSKLGKAALDQFAVRHGLAAPFSTPAAAPESTATH